MNRPAPISRTTAPSRSTTATARSPLVELRTGTRSRPSSRIANPSDPEGRLPERATGVTARSGETRDHRPSWKTWIVSPGPARSAPMSPNSRGPCPLRPTVARKLPSGPHCATTPGADTRAHNRPAPSMARARSGFGIVPSRSGSTVTVVGVSVRTQGVSPAWPGGPAAAPSSWSTEGHAARAASKARVRTRGGIGRNCGSAGGFAIIPKIRHQYGPPQSS